MNIVIETKYKFYIENNIFYTFKLLTIQISIYYFNTPTVLNYKSFYTIYISQEISIAIGVMYFSSYKLILQG
jgi:hypothetical protein